MNVSPRLLLVRRGQEEESFHCGRVVVATATGETVLAIGDTDAPVFPRSAIKPMQAIPLVASGAAENLVLLMPRLHLRVDLTLDHRYT